MDRKRGDDVIMTSLNRVCPQPHSIIHTKFGEDRMKNDWLMVFTSQKYAIFRKKTVPRDRGDDVIMTSLNRLQLDPYSNNPTKFDDDPM